jgi:phi LC3 family holin
MKNINWKVRAKNKMFWLLLVPMVLLLAEQVCALFGLAIEIEWLSEQLKAIIETAFGILAVIGIVADPTTKGLADSERAMEYTIPGGEE